MNCFKIFFNYKKQFHRQRNGDKMGIKLKNAALAFALGALFIPLQSQAQSDSVKIAFITDMSGLYSDFDGPGGLDAVRMAVSDFGGKVLGKPIEVLFADHQNKADIAANRARPDRKSVM